MTGKMFPLLVLASFIPAQALHAAVQPADAPTTATVKSKTGAGNKTIICSGIKEINEGLQLTFRDLTGERVIFHADNTTQANVEVIPALAKGLKCSFQNDNIYLEGEFQPLTRYTIRISGTLRSVSGNTLKQNLEVQHKTSELPPYLRFLTNGVYFSPGVKNFSIPYSLRTVKKYQLKISRLYDSNLNEPVLNSDRNILNLGEPVVDTTITTPKSAMQQTMYYGNLDLSQYIKNRKKGIYAVSISDPERFTDDWQYSNREDKRLVIVTDLGVSAAVDSAKGCAMIAVQSLSDGKAVKGATVHAISNKRQVIARGVTGKDGILNLEFSKKFKEQNHEYFSHFIIEKGDDKTVFHPNAGMNLPLAQNFIRSLADEPNAFVYGERNLFRPGETVRVSSFIRQMNKGKSAVLANAPLKFFLYSIDSQTILDTRMVRTDKYGYTSMEFKLPPHAALGSYRVYCGLTDKDDYGSFHFKISNFMPDRIKVSLKPEQDFITGNKSLTFTHNVNYYFGPAAENVTYRFSVQDQGPFMPDHFKGWTVGDKATAGNRTKPFNASGSKLAKKSCLIWPGYKTKEPVSTPVQMIASLRVNEPGGRSVTGYAPFVYYPTYQFIGIRKVTAVKNTDAAFDLKLLPALAAKETDSTADVTWTLYKQEWEYISRKSGDRYIREWDLIKTPIHKYKKELLTAVTDKQKKMIFSDLPEGYYLLSVRGKNMRTEISFWHEQGTAGERSRDPNKLVVKTDKETYLPGDTVKIKLSGKAGGSALIAYGESTIEGAFRYDFKKNGETELRIPIRRDLESESWYGILTLVNGKNNDVKRTHAFLKFKVDQKTRRLTPELKCLNKVKPGEKITVDIALTDGKGKPSAGLVHVFAVDEGVLAITGYKAPDIFNAFYGPVWFQPEMYDNYGNFFPDLRLLPDGSIGGGVMMKPSATSKFRDMTHQLKEIAVTFAPAVKVGKNGKGKVELALPDHTGAMRIMAVAASEKAAGSAEKQITMRNAISLTLSAPNVVNPGDTFDVACSVFNHDLPDSAYSIKVEPSNVYTIVTPAKNGTLAKGKSENFSIRCKAATAPGKGNITVTLSMNGVVQKETIPLNIRIPTALERRSNITVLESGKSKTYTVKANEFYRGKHTLTISASPAVSLPLALNYLNEYPYGCLEQTVSSAFPFLAMENLEKSGFLTPAAAASGKDRLALGIGNILSMQKANGGFSTWPGGRDVWSDGSVYAAHFLLEAYNRKMPGVTAKTVQNVLNWVENQISSNNASNNRLFCAYAGYVLALGNRDSGVQMMRNILTSEKQDFAAMIAAFALIRGGYAAEGASVLSDLMQAEVWRKPEMLCGCVNEAAGLGMTLYLLLENMPRHPEAIKIATLLAEKIRPDYNAWGGTQANAWAALGLAAFAADFPSNGNNTVVIRQNGKQQEYTVKTTLDIAMTPGKTVTVINSGKSVFTVRQTSEGHPVKAESRKGAIKLYRMYLNENGFPVTSVKHGEIVMVRIYLKSSKDIEDLVICDLLPAGLEIEDEHLLNRSSAKNIKKNGLYSKYMEKGVDRFLFFGDYCSSDRKEPAYLEYRTRAVSRGVYTLSGCSVQAMYDPDVTGSIADNRTFTVE